MEQDYTLVDLLRHGACEGGEIFRGTTDVALSTRGWEQMREAVDGDFGWDKIISSPLRRCQEFAREQAAHRELPLEINNNWREINFGVWEGREIKQVWKTDRAVIAGYFADPGSVTPEGGEPLDDARSRLISAWREMLDENRHQHILVVQHGGTIRLLLSHLLNAPLTTITRFDVSYAAMTRIRVYHDNDEHSPILVNHNPGYTQ